MYNNTIIHKDKEQWIKAMNDEITLLKHYNTQEYTYLPMNTNIIGTKFVYKLKQLANSKIDKYKVQLVVQGYMQKDRIDFYSDDLFALLTKLTTVQLLLSWAVSKDYKIHQVDIKSAYLYDKLNNNEHIYIQPPLGKLLNNIKLGQVLKLNKALYSLKQVGQQQYKKITEILQNISM